jgi:CRISPR-associated protein Cas2
MPRPGRMEILVAYDVSTETTAGRRRLRKVAQICLGFGQRVQNSVFECRVTEAQLEELEARLLDVIVEAEDRLRIYRLPGNREQFVRIYGSGPLYDLREPIIV